MKPLYEIFMPSCANCALSDPRDIQYSLDVTAPKVESAQTSLPRDAWPSLWLLLGINLLNYIDRYVLAAVEPLISKDLLPNDEHAHGKMGLLATAFLVSYMIAAPLLGAMADSWRRWGVVAVGVLLWSLATAGSGLATVFGVMLVMRMLVGIGEGGYGPVAPTIIADLFPESRRGRAMSLFYLAIPVGSALGYLLGGLISSQWGWRTAFYAALPPGLILGAWAFFKKDPQRIQSEKKAPERFSWARYKALLSNREYLLCVVGMTLMTFAMGGMSFWIPRYVSDFRKAGDLKEVNFLFGVITVVGGILAIAAGSWLADRFKKRFPGSYMLVSGVSMLIAFPLMIGVLYVPFPYAWGLIGLTIFFMFINTGPSNATIANVVTPELRMTAYALSIFMIHALGDAISPPVIGAITDATKGNMNMGFLVVSFTMLLSGLVWTWAGLKPPPQPPAPVASEAITAKAGDRAG